MLKEMVNLGFNYFTTNKGRKIDLGLVELFGEDHLLLFLGEFSAGFGFADFLFNFVLLCQCFHY